MRERADELDRLGLRVVAIAFESQARVDEYQRRERLPFPLLRDPKRAAYRAFGLERRPLTTIWGLPTLWYYVQQLLKGRLPAPATGDPLQLGGDVILRPGPRGGWIYRSAHPADRPSVESILALAGRAANAGAIESDGAGRGSTWP